MQCFSYFRIRSFGIYLRFTLPPHPITAYWRRVVRNVGQTSENGLHLNSNKQQRFFSSPVEICFQLQSFTLLKYLNNF
jgi:hypothetical protein